MGFKEMFSDFMSSYDRGLTEASKAIEQEGKKAVKAFDDWSERVEQRSKAHWEEQDRKKEEAERSRQLAIQEQNQQKLFNLQFYKEAEALIEQAKHNYAMEEMSKFQLERERDELERSKAAHRIELDRQRQQLDLERQHFDYEQERADKAQEHQHRYANKAQDNDFTLNMADRQIRREQQQQNHEYNMGKLGLEYQQLQYLKEQKAAEQRALDEAIKKMEDSFNGSGNDLNSAY